MLQTRAVDYVVFSVSDLEKVIPFYQDTLGLPFDYVYEGWWAEFASQPVSLALCGPPAGTAPRPGSPGGATVGLAVPAGAVAVEELRRAGVPVLLEPQESPVCWTAAVADPDGTRINLHQRKDGTAG